ncbi:MAG: AMP-binding protein [Nocardioidaceae bacterium]
MFVNVSEYLRDRAARSGDAVALVEAFGDRRQVTWSELDGHADAIARWLSRRGLVAGHRVGLCLGNRIEFVAACLGAMRAGLLVVPMNPRSAVGEFVRMIADSGSRVLFCDEATVHQVRHAAENVGAALSGAGDELRARAVVADLVVVEAVAEEGETRYEAVVATADGEVPPSPTDPETLATLLYTSGTSGKPRGVMLTHRALVANIEQVAAIEPPPMSPDDVILGLLPLFHIYGLNCILSQAVRQGARLVLVDHFDADATLDLVAEHAVTNIPIAPPVVAAWAGRTGLRERLATVRHVLSGASALDPELAAVFAESSGVVVEQGYGLTETAPVLTTTLAGGGRTPGGLPKPGSVGGPLQDVQIRIVDVSGQDAADDDPGEIWVRGPNLFSGYWPDGVDGPDADGWYATGDIGFLDADGDLTLVDRMRELVIVSGFNVYPSEVEEVIAELATVVEVAVIGVPDVETGEAVHAFVVPADEMAEDGAGRSLGEHALVEAVRAQCESRLARFKWPQHVTVVTGLPHSATGKVAKGRLRAQTRRDALGLG